MNRQLPLYAIAAILLAGFAGAQAQEQSQAQAQIVNVPLSRPGEPLTLEMSILSARMEVIGENRDDVQFEVSVVQGTRKIVTPSGTKSLKSGAYSIEVEEEDNHVEVDTDWRAGKVDVVVRVPRLANLELGTVNNGEIFVRDVSGNLVLENVNGPITATGISGSVIAEAINQTIRVDFDQVDPSAVTSFISINGDLSLGLPGSVGAELHIDSADGEIISDFEVEVMPNKPVVIRKNREKGMEVSVESVIIAKVNGGGPVIKLKTLNGDINIRKTD